MYNKVLQGLIVHRYADNYVAQSKKKKQKVKKSNRRIVIHTVLAVRCKMSCYVTGARGALRAFQGVFERRFTHEREVDRPHVNFDPPQKATVTEAP